MYRDRDRSFFAWVLGIGSLVLLIDILVLRRNSPHASPTFFVATFLCYAFSVVVLFRFATAAISTGARGVTVRTTWRTLRFRWDEIDHFEYGRCGINPSIGVLIDRHGSAHAIPVLQASALWYRSRPMPGDAEILDYLRRLLDYHRS